MHFITVGINIFLLFSSVETRGRLSTFTEHINGTEGNLTSPRYPEDYPENVNYTWILELGDIKTHIVFTIEDLDISWWIPCADYLQIRKTVPCCNAIFKKCGIYNGVISSTGTEFQVSFVTDHAFSGRGFKLEWKGNLSNTTFDRTIRRNAMEEPRTGRKTPKNPTVIERTRTTMKGNGELLHPTTLTLQYDQTKETTTQRSSALIESLLSSPLINGILFLSLFGVIVLLIVAIVSIVCQRKKRNRQSKQLYFCAVSDNISMHAYDTHSAQKPKRPTNGQEKENSTLYDDITVNDYTELSNVEYRPYELNAKHN